MVVAVSRFMNVTANDMGLYTWPDGTPHCYREWNPG